MSLSDAKQETHSPASFPATAVQTGSTMEELALHIAVEDGDLERCRTLIASGYSVHFRDSSFWTPLHYAAWTGRLEIAQLLLDTGAHIDAEDYEKKSPLFWVVQKGQQNRATMAKFLLEQGADPNRSDDRRWTPLHVAANLENIDLCRILLDAGALDTKRDEQHRVPLELCSSTRKDIYTLFESYRLKASLEQDPIQQESESRIFL